MQQIVLTKESGQEEIRKYFNSVLELSKRNEEFPVNLKEVWPLVYSAKEKAVRALKDDNQFIEGVDYQFLAKNGGKSDIGRPSKDCYLTISCLEFFIARKVRPVFEVYRKVFHRVADNQASVGYTIQDKLSVASWLIDTLKLNNNSTLRLAKAIADPMGLPTPDYTESKDQLLSATELLKRNKSNLSIYAFNALMVDKGLLATLERNSSKGGVKKFKSLTKEGLEYGENMVSPNNPRETQPLYYVSKFNGLLDELTKQQNV